MSQVGLKASLLEGSYTRIVCAVIANILLSFGLFFVARIIFYLDNWSLFETLDYGEVISIMRGGVVFDMAAVAYINIAYLLVMLVPLQFKEGECYQRVARWIFLTVNYLAFVMNIADALYYPFTKRRTTSTIFSEFGNDEGVVRVIFDEVVNSWLLIVISIAICYLVARLYRKPKGCLSKVNAKIYYPLQMAYMTLAVLLSIAAMRGGIGADVRPITISNANQYVADASNTALVLNTPFSMIRTLGKVSFKDPHYFLDEEMLNTVFTPVQPAVSGREQRAKNVVILIVESFGREYVGALNGCNLDGTKRASYTPFLDSLINESLSFDYSFANGLKSIDAMPSILSSVPMFIEPYFVTPASANRLSGVAGELSKVGYHTSFFHGAADGSMGFMAFSRATGFGSYYGREEFNDDTYFDGRWAIWDEEFLQYYASMLSSFKQPFASALFTASSHHPFKVPERYEGEFDKGTLPIHQCVGYTDNALRKFFDSASKEEWFDSTLFVITADHTSLTAYPEERTSFSIFNVPIILYQHNSQLKGRSDVIAQQIDIMPTVLNYLGYEGSYLCYGCDMLSTPASQSYAVNYVNGIYQYFEGDMSLMFDGEKSVGLFDFKNDPLQSTNLIGSDMVVQNRMELRLKAIIQQYMSRMERDDMLAR